MKQFLELAKHVHDNGVVTGNRTVNQARSVFGTQMRFDLSDFKIAAITTKKIHHKSIVHELIWMIKGETNVSYLQENGVTIWDEWADENGELGPVYGKQWRDVVSFRPIGLGVQKHHIDQLANVIESLKNNPDDRGIIVNSWNVSELEDMNLRPCHMMFQFYSVPNEVDGQPRKLSIHVYQRSVDVFLGLPFNLESYSILAHMVAQVTGHVAAELVHTGGNVHLYENHIPQINTQLSRSPKESVTTVKLNPLITSIDDFTYDDIEIVGYKSHPAIAGKVSV